MESRKILGGIICATGLAVFSGYAYILDCRLSGGEVDKCWLTGLPIAGIGGAAGGGFSLGYETLNPKLKRND